MKPMYGIYRIIVVILLAGVVANCSGTSKNPTKPSSCGGVVLADFCWYLGQLGQSCDTVCASHGGCNAGGITYAGSQGAAAACEDVLDALGADADNVGNETNEDNLSNTPALATGCSIDYVEGTIDRVVYWPGSCSPAFAKTRRACACNQ